MDLIFDPRVFLFGAGRVSLVRCVVATFLRREVGPPNDVVEIVRRVAGLDVCLLLNRRRIKAVHRWAMIISMNKIMGLCYDGLIFIR